MKIFSIFASCLAALPLFGQPSETTLTCGPTGPPRVVAVARAASPDDFIFYRVPVPEPTQMEVRYVVDGALYLDEVLDLSAPVAPPKHLSVQPSRNVTLDTQPNALGPARTSTRSAAVELLALNISEVHDLQRISKQEGRLVVEIRFDGQKIRTLTLPELLRESAEYLRSDVATVVRSVVSGPGVERKTTSRRNIPIQTTDYLTSCTQCTSTMPCDTECGWDPGKGGPDTCGEQGYCGECAPEAVLDEYEKVYPIGSGDTSADQLCFILSGGVSRWFQETYTQYRHDHVLYKMICSDAPNCVFCHTEEQVTSTFVETRTCWGNTGNSCNTNQVPYYTPACNILCQYWGGCQN